MCRPKTELGAIGLPDHAGTGFPRVLGCEESRNIYHPVFVARENGERACWSVDAVALPWESAADRLRAAAVAELRQRQASLPDIVIRTRLIRADTFHVLSAQIYQSVDVPAEGPRGWGWSHIMASPDRLARMTRHRDWRRHGGRCLTTASPVTCKRKTSVPLRGCHPDGGLRLVPQRQTHSHFARCAKYSAGGSDAPRQQRSLHRQAEA